MDLIKNQNVLIEQTVDGYKIISKQPSSTPGIYIRASVEKNTYYVINVVLSKIQENTSIKLWIGDTNKKTLHFSESLNERSHIFPYLNKDEDKILVGIFFNSNQEEHYFCLKSLTIEKSKLGSKILSWIVDLPLAI